jgi:CubicO group peptidase (beta-lactamase class C family)
MRPLLSSPALGSLGTLRFVARRAGTLVGAAQLCSALLLLHAVPAFAQRTPDLRAFDEYVARAARDWHVPGLAIAIVKGDSVVFAKGYGVIEQGKPAPVTEHTRFAIGSTTKAMTSAALAMLVDQGKLRWDDRVIDHIPELQLYDAYATRELTIRDLLTHRTGLPGTDLFWVVRDNPFTTAEMIRRLRYVRPTASFRSTWQYQNVVYALAGVVIERASGMSWDAFIRSRIFAPLGMRESEPLVAGIVGKTNVAVPHAERDGVRTVPIRSTDNIAPAGSVWSSVSDMSRWMRFVLDSGSVDGKRLITPATFREIVAPQIRAPSAEYPALELAQQHFFSYALGWFVQDYHGHTIWMHTGSIDGMSAIIGLMPEQRMGVYVLANLDHAELRHALMYEAFDLYADGPAHDWSTELRALFARRAARGAAPVHQAGTHPTYPLDRYAGTYVDSTYGPVVVSLAGGALRARWGKADFGVLEHWEHDAFRSRPSSPADQPTTLTFVPDGAGSVAAVRAFGVSFARSRDRSPNQ